MRRMPRRFLQEEDLPPLWLCARWAAPRGLDPRASSRPCLCLDDDVHTVLRCAPRPITVVPAVLPCRTLRAGMRPVIVTS
eukprot:1033041-Prymnesium_polylepis.1